MSAKTLDCLYLIRLVILHNTKCLIQWIYRKYCMHKSGNCSIIHRLQC